MRLWKINSASDNDSTLEFWENCSVSPSHVLYAHESRVWMSTILKNCVISVGEVSRIDHIFKNYLQFVFQFVENNVF